MFSQLKPSQLINSTRSAFWIPGFAVASWGPFIPFIKSNLHLTEDHLGYLLMCMALGATATLIYANQVISRFGCRAMVRFCGVILALCLVGVTVVDNVYVLGLILFLFGANNESIAIAANVNAAAVEKYLDRSLMSGFHGVYSLGNAVGVFIVASMLSANLDFIGSNMLLTAACMSWIVLVYCALIASRHMFTNMHEVEEFLNQRQNQPQQPTTQDGTQQATLENNINRRYKFDFMHPMLLMLGTMCFIMFVTEGSMLDWTGVFLNQYRSVEMSEAGYGFAAFAVMMTLCRLTGDRVVTLLGRKRVLTMGGVLVTAGICLAVTVPHPMVSVLGFGMVGMGASNIVPQCVSYAATVKDIPLHKSVFIVNAIGYVGGLFGPAVIGFLAHRIGLDYTFILLSCGTALVALAAYMKIKSGPLSSIQN